ncbi:MAG TPA: lytic transglycosylase domain-containing protein [Verrucomicrobiae bacterium]
MKRMRGVIFVLLLLPISMFAQSGGNALDLPDLVQSAQQWAKENLDSNVVNALPDMNDPVVQKFLRDVEQRFQGEYVIDLSGLKQTAKVVIPLLQNDEQTQPYAAWLSAQMDYFDVADEFSLTIPPPKSEQPNQPPPTPPNPTPKWERQVWVKQISGRPWSAAAKEYVPQLKPIFSAQKVPPELVWMAEVESSFDRRARSPVGAAGLFQLMPDTAKRFGLSLWPRDQRYQTEPSANASAEYLKYLYSRFHDWRLALAAYNAGEGTVQKLLDRHKTRSYDVIANHLPAETQMYVPRIEAILLQREGAKLEYLPAPPVATSSRPG